MRAATVDVGGRAVVIVGASAAGKSSVAAALALRGHPVLADGVTVAEPNEPGGTPLVRPLAPEKGARGRADAPWVRSGCLRSRGQPRQR